MNFFKFRNRKQCPHVFELKNHIGMILVQERCIHDAEHPGLHQTRFGQQWMTRMDQQRYLEEKFK